jgi:hypothetical protein
MDSSHLLFEIFSFTNLKQIKMKKHLSSKSIASTSKKTIVSDAIPPIAKDAEKSIAKLNLSKFADQLKSVNVTEKKDKQTIYLYPEGKGKDWINSEEGKKWRNNKRGKMQKFSDNILLYAKMNRMDDLEKEIGLFDLFYKEFFQINDYSLKSVSASANEGKTSNLSLMLEIVKSSK